MENHVFDVEILGTLVVRLPKSCPSQRSTHEQYEELHLLIFLSQKWQYTNTKHSGIDR